MSSEKSKVKPKVLLCCSSAPKFGLLKHMTTWACKMREDGINITVVSGPKEQEMGLFNILKSKGISIIIVNKLDHQFPYRLPKTIFQLRREIRDIKPDVIHVMGIGHGVDFFLSSIGILPKPKIICTLESCRHGTWGEKIAYHLGARIANFMFKKLVTISKDDREKMMKSGLNYKKSKYIPNFIDCDSFIERLKLNRKSPEIKKYLNKGNPNIIYIAQLIKRKGHIYLFKGLKIIKKQYPDAALILFGMGADEDLLKRYVNNLGINSSVYFFGQIPHDYVPSVLSYMDIAVISSLSETFGWAIIEPILAGVPVVSTRVGIASEVERADGLIGVPIKDEVSIAESVLKLLSNNELRKIVVENGKKYIENNFGIQRISNKYYKLYKDK